MRFTTAELRVLLVEPSTVQQQIILRMLGEAGVAIASTTTSGAAALEEMDLERPDMVISAFYLPDMTGADLILELRAHDDFHDVPFMLVSSEERFESLDPIRQAGPSAILRKPFGTEDLVRGLEAATAFVNAADDAHEDAAEFESLRVLTVDDTRVARKFIVRTLRRLGIEDIVEAENGLDAVGKLEEAVYDLVITDFNMPEMDGLGLVRHIRDESHQSSVPIIMVTSEDDEGRLTQVHQAGVSAICDKPFEVNHIRQLIGELVSV